MRSIGSGRRRVERPGSRGTAPEEVADLRSTARSDLTGSATQGEALGVWCLWGLLLIVTLITYTRLGAAELYNVSREGLPGALSRALVELNFPVSLVAIALVVLALDTLPRVWRPVGVSAIALCAVTAWPGVVDADDLDARLINAVPAAGVLIALVLTNRAVARTGTSPAPRRPFDGLRLAAIVVILVLSIPWLAAVLGVFLPEGIFIMERPITGADGAVGPAVHLGLHHGLDGALLAVTAIVLSRSRPRSVPLGRSANLYVSLMFAYGTVNFVQDVWNEQLVKREVTSWSIPSATEPELAPIWLVILALAAAASILLRREAARGKVSVDLGA